MRVENLTIDWHKILSSLVDFEVEDDFKILVINPSLIKLLLQAFGSLDDRTFANYFFLELLLKFRQAFTDYFLAVNEQTSWGIQKAQQRFEQCSRIVKLNIPVAFTSLLVERFGKKITIIEEIANRTMKMIIDKLESDEHIPSQHLRFMNDKLKSLKLILAYPKEMLNVGNVEEVYRDLKLNGSESFLKIFVETYLFSKDQEFKNFIKVGNIGVERNESSRWIDYTSENEYETPVYNLNANNIICE